jgi:hypothetical protein
VRTTSKRSVSSGGQGGDNDDDMATIASHNGPGLKSNLVTFFLLIFVRIHTNKFIQLLYKSCSKNSYTALFLYQFIHFLYELYSTNSYNEPQARAARVKPEHTSCPDQAAPGCPDPRPVRVRSWGGWVKNLD